MIHILTQHTYFGIYPKNRAIYKKYKCTIGFYVKKSINNSLYSFNKFCKTEIQNVKLSKSLCTSQMKSISTNLFVAFFVLSKRSKLMRQPQLCISTLCLKKDDQNGYFCENLKIEVSLNYNTLLYKKVEMRNC